MDNGSKKARQPADRPDGREKARPAQCPLRQIIEEFLAGLSWAG